MVQLGGCASASAPGDTSRTARRGQQGFSLLEILIAVMLVSLAVLGLAMGFLTLVRTNRASYERQQVDHAATNYAESLKAAQYLPCVPSDPDPDYDAGPDLWEPSRGVEVQVIDVEYWNSVSQDYQEACPGPDAGTQRVTILAEWRGHERQAQIVKRNR